MKHSDWTDVGFMAMGTMGCVADGSSLALTMLVVSNLMDTYSAASLNQQDINKVCLNQQNCYSAASLNQQDINKVCLNQQNCYSAASLNQQDINKVCLNQQNCYSAASLNQQDINKFAVILLHEAGGVGLGGFLVYTNGLLTNNAANGNITSSHDFSSSSNLPDQDSISSSMPSLLYPRKNVSFTARLIHRTSPKSPFYDPNAKRNDLIGDGIRTSLARAHFLGKRTSTLVESLINARSPVRVIGVDFVMSYSIGTPTIKTFGIADTASHVIWLQCQPCDRGYKQSIPFYDRDESSKVFLADLDVIHLEMQHVTRHPGGPGTPLVPNGFGHYRLSLVGLMVSGEDIDYDFSGYNQAPKYDGGFVIDTGTLYTVLDEPIFNALREKIAYEVYDEEPQAYNEIDHGTRFELCYKNAPDYPEVEFQFANQMELMLCKCNTWVKVSNGLHCLAILKASEGISVLGMYSVPAEAPSSWI
ncbi:hypothetical protein RJ639_008776 [Escallonia herrerae]|uniref:Peptidase A1 domain-containing protein n=1 Tax=Escallonia herrerae TaxID=1293975 RepID=A0AA89AS54_9ASTE|nr:hypothetical protein RJ639_008776 [Escallonia herrerae]